jgi:hypothetical protein
VRFQLRVLRKFFALLPLSLLCTAAAAQQPGARVRLDSLDKFARLAAESEIKEEPTKDGRGMVYVRHFEFAREGAYAADDLAAIRAQVSGGGWSRLLKVEERDDEPDENENAEIYVYGAADAEKAHTGMLIITTQTKEFTVVNIVGRGGSKDAPARHARKKAAPRSPRRRAHAPQRLSGSRL